MEWQPIDTAPKGELLLGYDPRQDDNQRIGTIFWYEGWWVTAHSLDDNSHYMATHWMPLPAPPPSR